MYFLPVIFLCRYLCFQGVCLSLSWYFILKATIFLNHLKSMYELHTYDYKNVTLLYKCDLSVYAQSYTLTYTPTYF